MSDIEGHFNGLYKRFLAPVKSTYPPSSFKCLFLVERAWYHYTDRMKLDHPELPSFSKLKEFGEQMFQHVKELQIYKSRLKNYFKKLSEFKRKIPVCGAIILDNTYSWVLLVRHGRYGSWTFPRGKIEEGESMVVCAVREVAEETGLDISHDIREELCLVRRPNGKPVILFLVGGFSIDKLKFRSNCLDEIGGFSWFHLDDLMNDGPYCSGEGEDVGFFDMSPFISQIREWAVLKIKDLNLKDQASLDDDPLHTADDPDHPQSVHPHPADHMSVPNESSLTDSNENAEAKIFADDVRSITAIFKLCQKKKTNSNSRFCCAPSFPHLHDLHESSDLILASSCHHSSLISSRSSHSISNTCSSVASIDDPLSHSSEELLTGSVEAERERGDDQDLVSVEGDETLEGDLDNPEEKARLKRERRRVNRSNRKRMKLLDQKENKQEKGGGSNDSSTMTVIKEMTQATIIKVNTIKEEEVLKKEKEENTELDQNISASITPLDNPGQVLQHQAQQSIQPCTPLGSGSSEAAIADLKRVKPKKAECDIIEMSSKLIKKANQVINKEAKKMVAQNGLSKPSKYGGDGTQSLDVKNTEIDGELPYSNEIARLRKEKTIAMDELISFTTRMKDLLERVSKTNCKINDLVGKSKSTKALSKNAVNGKNKDEVALGSLKDGVVPKQGEEGGEEEGKPPKKIEKEERKPPKTVEKEKKPPKSVEEEERKPPKKVEEEEENEKVMIKEELKEVGSVENVEIEEENALKKEEHVEDEMILPSIYKVPLRDTRFLNCFLDAVREAKVFKKVYLRPLRMENLAGDFVRQQETRLCGTSF